MGSGDWGLVLGASVYGLRYSGFGVGCLGMKFLVFRDRCFWGFGFEV